MIRKLEKHTIGICDGIVTDSGARYYKFQGLDRLVWFSGESWLSSEVEVRRRIHSATGCMISQAAAIADLRHQIDEWSTFRTGLVAEYPGWLGNAFICGDGSPKTVQNQPSLDALVFNPLPKFFPRGTLEDWQHTMAPFVSGQHLPFFVCCLALSGPLLRLLPPGMVPPQVELVGERECGKSTLGTLAASIWSGDPEETEGGGETWDMTINAYDVHRRNHRDMFLLLDEAETSAESSGIRRDVAKMIVMKGASTGVKVRYTDTQSSPPLRVPILSTTNTPIVDVLKGAGTDTIGAATSRMISLHLSAGASGLAIFDTVPNGYAVMQEAVIGLRSSVNEVYGLAGPAFAAGLVDLLVADEAALRVRIKKRISAVCKRLRTRSPNGHQRHRDMLATIEVAGRLAQKFGILPKSWGKPSSVIDFVYSQIITDAHQSEPTLESEIQRFAEYLQLQVGSKKAFPLWVRHKVDGRFCDAHPIVVDRTEQDIVVAYLRPDYFQASFDNHKGFLAGMKRHGKLVRHKSERNDRLQIHAPTEISRYGFKRVYAIILDEQATKAITAARRALRSKHRKSKKRKAACDDTTLARRAIRP